MKSVFVPFVALMLLVTGCAQKPGQDTYYAGELGESRAVEFGTVLNARQVEVIGNNSGTGALLGLGTGAGAGSYVGNGSGQAWATVAGAVAGAVAGHMIEEGIQASQGHEYTVELLNGDIKMIVQEDIEGEKIFKAGDKVMLQYCDAGEYNYKCRSDSKNRKYQRLLPVQKFPSKHKSKSKAKSKRASRDDVEPAYIEESSSWQN